jgi:hypothetical protein
MQNLRIFVAPKTERLGLMCIALASYSGGPGFK